MFINFYKKECYFVIFPAIEYEGYFEVKDIENNWWIGLPAIRDDRYFPFGPHLHR